MRSQTNVTEYNFTKNTMLLSITVYKEYNVTEYNCLQRIQYY